MQASQNPSFTPRRFGKYLLLERIGRGGMAEVYRSKTFGAAGFVKECAIKKILTSLLDDDQFVRMFIDEAKLTAFLNHSNVVQVLDLGEIDGHLFIAMEYVAGKDLLDVLARSARRGVRIPEELSLYIATEMLKGLDFAHKARDSKGEHMGIVHRDVSPSNILISYDGQVKVGDFGIAKSQMQSSRTEVGTQKGKTGYMSPEQVTGGVIDQRSDLFAAAVILFEMLTMTRLFKAKNDLEVMLKIRDADVAVDLERAARVSPGLAEIIRKGLARDPDDRYASGAEFLEDLREYIQERKLKIGAASLSAYVSELFHDKIENEQERRNQDPAADAGFDAVPNAHQSLFRYRDHEGMIHGPMRPAMMAELLGSRTPNQLEAISFDGGAWRAVAGFAEFADVDRPTPGSTPPPNPEAESGLGLRMQKGVDDWEDLSLAGVNPNSRRRRRTGSINVDVDESGAIPRTRRDPRVIETREVASVDDAYSKPTSLEDRHTRPRRRSGGQKIANSERTTPVGRSSADSSELERFVAAQGAAATEVSNVAEAESPHAGSRPDVATGPVAPPEAPASPKPARKPESKTVSANYPAATPLHSQSEVEALRSEAVAEAGPGIISGQLGATSVFRIVHCVNQAALSGRLRVIGDDGVRKDFYFEDGALTAADSTAASDSLLEVLRGREIISREQAEEASARAAADGVSLGDALLHMRAIVPHTLFHFMQEQLAEKLLRTVFWESGQWEWFPGVEFEKDQFPTVVSVPELLSRALNEHAESRYFRRFYKTRRRTKLFQRLSGDELVPLTLSARAMRILSSLDKCDTISEIVRIFADRYSWVEAEVYRTVYMLTESEVLAFEGDDARTLLG